MERQRFYVLYLGMSCGYETTLIHNRTVAGLSIHNWLQQHRYYVLNICVNGVSSASRLASWNMQQLYSHIKL